MLSSPKLSSEQTPSPSHTAVKRVTPLSLVRKLQNLWSTVMCLAMANHLHWQLPFLWEGTWQGPAGKYRNSWKNPDSPEITTHISAWSVSGAVSSTCVTWMQKETTSSGNEWGSLFNSVTFHSHWGGMQMTVQSSSTKQSEEAWKGRLRPECQVELLIYFSQHQSASWYIIWTE